MRYERLGVGYARFRRPDPRLAHQIRAALGSAGPVLNIGTWARRHADLLALEHYDAGYRLVVATP